MRRTPLTTTPRRAVPVEMETTEVEDCRDESLAGSGAGFTTDTSLASTDDDSLSRRISLSVLCASEPSFTLYSPPRNNNNPRPPRSASVVDLTIQSVAVRPLT